MTHEQVAMVEERVHFAGEHTASLAFYGTMQGALESGIRVATEVDQADEQLNEP